MANGKLVFILTTGREDMQTVVMSLKHAVGAQKTGLLREVAWLSYERGVAAVASSMVRPPALLTALKEARGGGVPMFVCANALQRMGIPREKVDGAQVVPSGIVKVAELVAEGYTVIRY